MCLMPPTADAPNEAKLLALPGKGAFEQSAEWRERDRKLVRREPACLQAVAGLARQVVPWLTLAVQNCPARLAGRLTSRLLGGQQYRGWQLATGQKHALEMPQPIKPEPPWAGCCAGVEPEEFEGRAGAHAALPTHRCAGPRLACHRHLYASSHCSS